MREQTRYSDIDRAAALTALEVNGGNVQKTAAQQNIPMATLWEWSKGRHNADVTTMKEGMKVELAERMEKLAETCLNLLTPEKLGEASAAQLATITGIAVDKMQVLRGKPDSILTTQVLNPDERANRLMEIVAEARQNKAQAEAQAEQNSLKMSAS